MKNTIRNAISTAALLLACCGPAFADDDDLRAEADKAIKVLQNADSGLTNHFNRAAGFAVFPSVGKGGLFFGAEHGNGVVYEKDLGANTSAVAGAMTAFHKDPTWFAAE